MFQPQKRQQWFFRHLPWREMSQVKALVLPEGSAGVWWLVCGTPSLRDTWVSPVQGGFIAEELGSSCKAEFTWIEQRLLIRAQELNPREGDVSNTSGRPWSQWSTMFHVDCKNQQSATGNYLPQLHQLCLQRGGRQGREGSSALLPHWWSWEGSLHLCPVVISLFHLSHSHLALIFPNKGWRSSQLLACSCLTSTFAGQTWLGCNAVTGANVPPWLSTPARRGVPRLHTNPNQYYLSGWMCEPAASPPPNAHSHPLHPVGISRREPDVCW